MTSHTPDRPTWPSIAAHLEMLARSPDQPFTAADVERAYAFLFLPFLDYEVPTVRARLFRDGLALAIEQLSNVEECVLAQHMLLHNAHASQAARRRAALAELSQPPINLGGVIDEKTLARVEPRAFDNLARILTSEAFAEKFREHFTDEVSTQPLAPPPQRGMDWLSYGQIATLRDEPESFLRRITVIRARSNLDGLQVVALPFFWIRPEPPEHNLFPTIDVLTDVHKHSFIGFRPDPRPTSKDWFVAVFHLGAKRPVGNEFKLVYRETWTSFAPNADENNLAFSVGGQSLRHVHLSARLPSELKPRRFRGARVDTASGRKPEELPIQTYGPSATLRVSRPSPGARYMLDWVDALARPLLE